ncbi:hypothetical protein HanXRQr2_Chr16g0766951 [Helianthus annuus]|uniref:Uncharacterized protein n=1 Tax=Helianthus annuus TaxID=4232 RepID=A0A9K3DU84_HELAN|nr:hypothetical protein HanXRQr2_Chr16g0766951 [Helianthus annuus]KAJ0822698.1 hypothetical protein HanPSC8_Chr16g0735161 [Helianthus annuus]
MVFRSFHSSIDCFNVLLGRNDDLSKGVMVNGQKLLPSYSHQPTISQWQLVQTCDQTPFQRGPP